MDPEDLVVEAFGVMLTQVRTARRALEDVQRNTSRYMGFEFAKALAQGPKFGQPPMFQGALMVHVVNINDLAPGNSFGGFIEAVFGGIGNFFSNLIGGTVGGFITSLALPDMIESLERIVQNVGAILERLGVGNSAQGGTGEASTEGGGGGDTPSNNTETQAATGESLLDSLNGMRGVIRDVTALFQAASSGPGDSAGARDAATTSARPLTETGERWMAILHGVNRLLDRTGHVVDGLILAIPMVIGSIALLVTSLGQVRRALLETVQFFLRNALILRGVVLTVIYETVSSAARLAASIVSLLGTTIQGVLTSIVGVIQALLGAAFDALSTLTGALQSVVRSLLQWLVTGVFDTLRAIGDLRVFRTLDHLVRTLPALLPPVFMLMNAGEQLPANVMGMLQTAMDAAFPAGAAAGGAGSGSAAADASTEIEIGAFPDLDEILDPLEDSLSSGISATSASLQLAAEETFGDAQGALSGLAGRFDSELTAEADFSRGVLNAHVERITGQAATLAETVAAPLAEEDPATGLEEIASAYEDWLTGGGLSALMGQIAPHFTNRPQGEEPGGSLRLLRGQFDRPGASVEIERVEIVLAEPGADAGAGGPDGPDAEDAIDCNACSTDEQIYEAVMRHIAEMETRGIRPADPRTYAR